MLKVRIRKPKRTEVYIQDDKAVVIRPQKVKKIEVWDENPIWYRERLVDGQWVLEYDPKVELPF